MYHYLVLDIYFILLVDVFYEIIAWCELNQYAQNVCAPKVGIIHGHVAYIPCKNSNPVRGAHPVNNYIIIIFLIF
jgi:hypothetical protein